MGQHVGTSPCDVKHGGGDGAGEGADIIYRDGMPNDRFRTVLRSLAATAVVVAVAACAPIVDHRGNLPDQYVLQEIKPGTTSRDDVANMLGSPSSVATFGEETWYYISTETERLAFYEPEVLDQQVVAIAFDSAGLVKSVRRYGLDDAREIELVERKTRTGGKKLTILQQLIGNLGRFTNRPAPE